jgi:hypothetical protein
MEEPDEKRLEEIVKAHFEQEENGAKKIVESE